MMGECGSNKEYKNYYKALRACHEVETIEELEKRLNEYDISIHVSARKKTDPTYHYELLDELKDKHPTLAECLERKEYDTALALCQITEYKLNITTTWKGMLRGDRLPKRKPQYKD